MWQPYQPYTDNAGIVQIDQDNESISVEYRNGKRFRFSRSTHGEHVAKMKEMANEQRSGLTRYIKENELKGDVLPDSPRYA
jgi:hypothetical protein